MVITLLALIILQTINTELTGKQNTVTGAASTVVTNNLTASRVLVSDSSGKITNSSISDTELGRLSGVSSNIQTQLNNKANGNWTHAAQLTLTTNGQTYTNAGLGTATEILILVELDNFISDFIVLPYHLYSQQTNRTIVLDDRRGVWNAVNIGIESNTSFSYYKSTSTTVSIKLDVYFR